MYTYVYTHVRGSVAAHRRGAWGGRRRGLGSPAKKPKRRELRGEGVFMCLLLIAYYLLPITYCNTTHTRNTQHVH